MAHYITLVDTFERYYSVFIDFFLQRKMQKRYIDTTVPTLPRDMIIRELKLLNFIVPERKEKNFLEDLRLFTCDYYAKSPGRYGIRGGGGFAKLYENWLVKRLMKMIPSAEPINIMKYKRDFNLYHNMYKNKFFAYAYPLVKIKDGFIKSGPNKGAEWI